MFQLTQAVQSVAPYCGLLAGICALTATSYTALLGGESFPSRASIESVLVGHERGRWLTLEHGTLLMTELVVDAQIANGTGAASPSAYLVPYVPEAVSGPSSIQTDPVSLAIIRFEPDDFEARFPDAHALVSEGGRQGNGLFDVAFDRRSCEVLRADPYDLSPHVRHFLLDRWGIEEGALLLFHAGAQPMSRLVAVLLVSTGAGLALAAGLALVRRATDRADTHGVW